MFPDDQKPKVVRDLLQCYSKKIYISENKKIDLKELREKGLIPCPLLIFISRYKQNLMLNWFLWCNQPLYFYNCIIG